MWVGEGLRWAGDVAGQWCSIDQLIWNTCGATCPTRCPRPPNTHIRASTKRSYGYHSREALIAMAMLTRGGLTLALPGRQP